MSSRELDPKVLNSRVAIQFEYFFLTKRQNGKCDVRNFRWFLLGMSPDM